MLNSTFLIGGIIGCCVLLALNSFPNVGWTMCWIGAAILYMGVLIGLS